MSCMSLSPSDTLQVCVGGNDILKLYTWEEAETGSLGYIFKEKENLLHTRKVIQHIDVTDVDWNPNDINIIASSLANGHILIWDLHTSLSINSSLYKPQTTNLASNPSSAMLNSMQSPSLVSTTPPTSTFSHNNTNSNINNSNSSNNNTNNNNNSNGNGGQNQETRSLRGHTRCTNRITWHPTNKDILLSGSMDGTIKAWDLRIQDGGNALLKSTVASPIRDIEFNPHNHYIVAAAQENGNVAIWDYRRADKPITQVTAHNGFAMCVAWHPTFNGMLASGGRDGQIKIWNFTHTSSAASSILNLPVFSSESAPITGSLHSQPMSSSKNSSSAGISQRSDTVISTLDAVNQILWCPNRQYLLSASVASSDTIYSWDIRAPNVPLVKMSVGDSTVVRFHWAMNKKKFSSSINSPLQGFASQSSSNQQKSTNLIPGIEKGEWTIALRKEGKLSLHSIYQSPHPLSSVPVIRMTFSPFGELSFFCNKIAKDFTVMLIDEKEEPFPKGRKFPKFQTHSSNRIRLGRAIPLSLPSSNWKESSTMDGFDVKTFTFLAQSYKLPDMYMTATFEEICEYNASIAEQVGLHSVSKLWKLLQLLFKPRIIDDFLSQSNTFQLGINMKFQGNIDDEIFSSGYDNNDFSSRQSSRRMSVTEEKNEYLSSHLNENNQSSHESEYSELLFVPTSHEIQHEEDSEIIDTHGSPGFSESLHGGLDFLLPYGSKSKLQGQMKLIKSLNSLVPLPDFTGFQYHCPLLTGATSFLQDATSVSVNQNSSPVLTASKIILPAHYSAASQAFSIGPNMRSKRLESPSPYMNVMPRSGLIRSASSESSSNQSRDGEQPSTLSANSPPTNNCLDWVLHNLNIPDILQFFADVGDVQTSATVTLVLINHIQHLKNQGIASPITIPGRQIRAWTYSYILLLKRLGMDNIATYIAKFTPDTGIRNLNSMNSTLSIRCTVCTAQIPSLSQSHGRCPNCKIPTQVPTKPAIKCSICNEAACFGVFVWCQGCGHGGHMNHMSSWFIKKGHVQCPTGCGHECSALKKSLEQ